MLWSLLPDTVLGDAGEHKHGVDHARRGHGAGARLQQRNTYELWYSTWFERLLRAGARGSKLLLSAYTGPASAAGLYTMPSTTISLARVQNVSVLVQHDGNFNNGTAGQRPPSVLAVCARTVASAWLPTLLA